jgi:hypothetical protein
LRARTFPSAVRTCILGGGISAVYTVVVFAREMDVDHLGGLAFRIRNRNLLVVALDWAGECCLETAFSVAQDHRDTETYHRAVLLVCV